MIRLHLRTINKLHLKLKILVLIFCLGYIGLFRSDSGYAETCPQVFQPGETIVYTLKWGAVSAGEVRLVVLPNTIMAGVEAAHFRMTAESFRMLDFVYKVRNRIDSYTSPCLSRSLYYVKQQREGKTKRDIEVIFDHEKGKTIYHDSRRKPADFSMIPGSMDPLGLLYLIRNIPMKENTEIQVPVTDGKKSVMGKLRVLGKETIKIGSKEVSAYLLDPDLEHLGGVFESSRDTRMKIWISDDDPKVILRMQTKVLVGSFILELKEYIPPKTVPEAGKGR